MRRLAGVTFAVLFMTLGSAAPAQTTGQQRYPPPDTLPSAPAVTATKAAVQNYSVWPLAIPPGNTLIVTSTDNPVPNVCEDARITQFSVVCRDPDTHGQIEYTREYVLRIQVRPPSYAALGTLKKTAYITGAAELFLVTACTFECGSANKALAYPGLGLLATGLVLHLVQHHIRHKEGRTLYAAH